MPEEKTRVDFNAPSSLVARVDAVAELLGTSRTRILVDALREELDDLLHAEEVRRLVNDEFYAGRLDFDTVEAVLGTEEALRMQLLRDSIDRDPPQPAITDPPTAAEFYEASVGEWTPDEETDDEESPA